MPPWIEPSCPLCSSLRVKTLPPGAQASPKKEKKEKEEEVDTDGAQQPSP
jgi:hypothetical protein